MAEVSTNHQKKNGVLATIAINMSKRNPLIRFANWSFIFALRMIEDLSVFGFLSDLLARPRQYPNAVRSVDTNCCAGACGGKLLEDR